MTYQNSRLLTAHKVISETKGVQVGYKALHISIQMCNLLCLKKIIHIQVPTRNVSIGTEWDRFQLVDFHLYPKMIRYNYNVLSCLAQYLLQLMQDPVCFNYMKAE